MTGATLPQHRPRSSLHHLQLRVDTPPQIGDMTHCASGTAAIRRRSLPHPEGRAGRRVDADPLLRPCPGRALHLAGLVLPQGLGWGAVWSAPRLQGFADRWAFRRRCGEAHQVNGCVGGGLRWSSERRLLRWCGEASGCSSSSGARRPGCRGTGCPSAASWNPVRRRRHRRDRTARHHLHLAHRRPLGRRLARAGRCHVLGNGLRSHAARCRLRLLGPARRAAHCSGDAHPQNRGP